MNDDSNQNGMAAILPMEPLPEQTTIDLDTATEQPEAPAPTPADDWQAKVREAAGQARAEEATYESLKERASNQKKVWEASVERLMRLIERDSPDEPLFADLQADEPIPVIVQPGDDSWKDFSVVEALVGLPVGITKALLDAQLSTVGELAAWSDSGKLLMDVPGIGQAKADKIEAALDTFWKLRNAVKEAVDVPQMDGNQEVP